MLKYLVLIFLYFDTTSSLSQNFTRHLPHFNKDLSVTYTIGETLIFAYALCLRYEEIGRPRPEKRCRLTLETNSLKSGLRTRRCETGLFARRKIGRIGNDYRLEKFGEDHLIFVWKEEMKRRADDNEEMRNDYFREFLRVRVLDMSTCDFREINVVADKSGEAGSKGESLNIITYEDGKMELFFRNGHLCGMDRRCRLTYSTEDGKFSVPPEPFLPMDHASSSEILPILARNSSIVLGYVSKTRSYDEGSINLINSKDRQVLFNHLYSWSPFNIPRRISNIAVSTEEETFGLCQQEMFEPTLKCSLFDLQGNATLGLEISIKTADVALIRMRNTSNGGFIVLVAYVLDYSHSTFESIDILEIDRFGELLRIRSNKGGFECYPDESGMDIEFFIKKNTGYCYYIACSWPGPWSNRTIDDDYRLSVYSQCYDYSEVVKAVF